VVVGQKVLNFLSPPEFSLKVLCLFLFLFYFYFYFYLLEGIGKKRGFLNVIFCF
jgi:hypothetical protein